MDRMRRWLEDLALGQYAEAFAASDIDLEVLPELGDQDLKELGLSLGHRKKLLKAIAVLAETPAPSPAPRTEAERRQLTVMFCDLVDSTALSAKLDPEDMREVIRGYQDACAGAITRFEGFVAKYMGDGVLAYFGYPRAHEDDAERAVRAGLALVDAVAKLPVTAGDPLAARIGIATGLVVVGDLVGEGAAQEQAVVGDTPNLAARLQVLAGPGQVLIAGATRRLVGAGFDLTDLGPQALKGLAEPVEAFAVLGARALASRFEAHRGRILPMVGRDQELALLMERWAQARAGEGQGVLLVGEAGIGKSRITRALLDALAEEPHTRIRYQCSPYHRVSALWPVIQQLTHAAGFGPDDPLEAKLDKLAALLERAGGHDTAPLVADLIGVDGTTRYGRLDLTPQAQRARTLDALVDQLIGLAAKQPVLVVLEDAHWIDPTTLELMEQCLDRIAEVSVLIVLTSRPDQQPQLAGHPHMTRFTLNRLGHAGVEAIVTRLGGNHLPNETIEAIIARTDGVPLFVEELTKAVLETGETTIPASLHDSLVARLDRIPEVKEIAQIAACIGREFAYTLLDAVAGKPEPELRAGLDKLAAAEIVFRRGAPPDARYIFKHALVRDAAYQSLLKSTRQRLHARTAAALETSFPEIVTNEPELLAHHLTEGGLGRKAVAYWSNAGQRAVERSANAEAVAHFRKALDVLRRRSTEASTSQLDAELQLRLGAALIPVSGHGDEAVRQAFLQAEKLSRQAGDSERRFLALRGVWNNHLLRGEIHEAGRLASQIHDLAQHSGERDRLLMGYRVAGTTHFQRGELSPAMVLFEEGLKLWEYARHTDLVAAYGEDPGLLCCIYGSWVDDLLGHREHGLQRSNNALAAAREFPNRFSLAYALAYAATLHVFRRDARQVERHADAGIALSVEQGFPQWQAWCLISRGWAIARQDRSKEGIAQLQEGIRAWRNLHSILALPHFLTLLAEAHLAHGDRVAAAQALDQAEEIVSRTDHRVFEPDIYRQRGSLLIEGDTAQRQEAERQFMCSIKVASKQSAKTIELRAATSLARLWSEQGKRQKAHDLLAPIYAWFTEGFDTPDLVDAKALLDDLGSNAAAM